MGGEEVCAEREETRSQVTKGRRCLKPLRSLVRGTQKAAATAENVGMSHWGRGRIPWRKSVINVHIETWIVHLGVFLVQK